MFAALASAAARPQALPSSRPTPTRRSAPLAFSARGRVTVVRAGADDQFGAASAPSLDAAPPMKNKDAKKAEKKAAKAAKPPPKLQKPKRRKAPSGEKKVDLPPTEAELAASAKYDAMIAEGGLVYECFIRAKGPNQWFPLGPMAVKQDWMIVPEMWKAEDAMKKAGFKMYPALMKAPCFGNVEYGYRPRDDASKITEEQIREAKGKLNPFEDVKLLERGEGDGPPQESLMDKFNKFMNPYGDGKK